MQNRLIKTLEEILKYLPVQMTTTIAMVDPFFANAERTHLKNIIGKEQLNALVGIYSAAGSIVETIGDPEHKEAVILSQKIVTTIGYYYAIPILSVKMGPGGIHINSSETVKQAFNWQVDDIKKTLLDLGFGAIEELLLLMEENPDKFSEYIDSDQFISAEQFLIESAKDFDQYFRISQSRFVFNSISYIMLRIENQVVKRLYGHSFFESLKSDNQEEKSKILVETYIKPGIALLTAEKALVERVITFQNGVASVNLTGNYESVKANIPATRDEVKAASEQLNKDGNQFLADGLDYINENASDFPDFIRTTNKPRYHITNNPDAGIIAI